MNPHPLRETLYIRTLESMKENNPKLFQARFMACPDCCKAAWERAEKEGGKSVAPIFDGMRVPDAEIVACSGHQEDAQW